MTVTGGQEFKRNDVNINRQNMANWTIQCADRYLAVLYDHLHKLLCQYHLPARCQVYKPPRSVLGHHRQACLYALLYPLWLLIDTIRGAKSGAIIYSITETAKANNLKVYEYVGYLLTGTFAVSVML